MPLQCFSPEYEGVHCLPILVASHVRARLCCRVGEMSLCTRVQNTPTLTTPPSCEIEMAFCDVGLAKKKTCLRMFAVSEGMAVNEQIICICRRVTSTRTLALSVEEAASM